jgi:hypothetical protein
MRYIFLDFDGVMVSMDYLHAWHSVTRARGTGFRRTDEYGDDFDPRCTMHLERILRQTEATIIVSSTWRGSGLDRMREMWKARNLYGTITAVTPFDTRRHRGTEIKSCLKSYPAESYVILDDDSDMLPEQLDNFVKIDSIFGLSFADAEKAIEILKKTNPA